MKTPKGCTRMTSYKAAIVLLNDLEVFADTHEIPEAENLIAKARMDLVACSSRTEIV